MGVRLLYLILFLILLILGCQKKESFNGIVYNKPAYNFCLKTEENGKVKEVCLKDILKEKDVVLVFFGYTHCPDVCPAAMEVLKNTMKKLDEDDRKRVQVVFISVDPERDTPKVVSQYAKYFDRSFLGLTGTPEEIKEVARAYRVFYEKVPQKGSKDYLVNHSALIYLITKDGKIKLIYSATKQKPNLIAEDIENLL